jgi:TonB-dependent starch-binding outer membrane protein SusC
MRKKRLTTLCLTGLFLLLNMGIGLAQRTLIKGNIVDATNNMALPGVNVIEKGTANGTVSDINGDFVIEVAGHGSSLEFSYIGYLTQAVEVGEKTLISVKLIEDVTKLEEVVVIGYGTQKKSDLTGAVSVVNTSQIEKVVASDISKVLQGQSAGLQVHGSGEPGAVPKIKIRGIGSFQNTDPLYVVDGVPVATSTDVSIGRYGSAVPSGGISDFNPADIESVQILKDASACAIYGARGANGVIIITTKRGSQGDMKVSYEGNYGVQNIVKRMELANRVQFQEIQNLARENDGTTIAPANDTTSEFYIDTIDTDWQKEVFTSGYITDHLLTFMGGRENSTYYASLNYFDQKGTMVGPGPRYTRYSVKFNSDQKRGRFKFGQSVYYGYSEQIRLTNSQWGNPIYETILGIPTVPVYDENNVGGYGGGGDSHDMIAGNQVAFNNLKSTVTYRNRFLGVVYGELEIIKGLTFKINLSYDRSDWKNEIFEPKYNVGTRHINARAFLEQYKVENPYMIMEDILTYSKTIKSHDFSVMVGYTAQMDYYDEISAKAYYDSEPYMKVISAGADPSSRGSLYEHRMLSYLGRLNYAYADKYLLTANFRRDYSSRFAESNRSADFPSLALAWKISKEKFFTVPYINLLKIRAGYGIIGNERIGDYQYYASINSAVTYPFGNSLPPGATQTNLVDESIHWEEKVTKNIGVDLVMFNNRIEFTAEYYNNDARDLLLEFPIPSSTGDVGSRIYTNAASMINQGFEFSLVYKNTKGDFSYEIGANVTTLKNEVTSLGKTNAPVERGTSLTEVGRSMGDLYGYVYEGIFQNDNEINRVQPTDTRYDYTRHAFQTSYTRAGDVKFKDINGDGSVTSDSDRVYLGTSFPKLTGGLNVNLDYKGFDLTMFFYGIYGNKVFNGEYQVINALKEGNYSVESYENYWRGEGTSYSTPQPTVRDYNDNNRVSARWIQDGSYLRLQNIQLGYNIPSGVLQKLKVIGSFRVYVGSQNLFTFTKYTGYDPDFNNDGLFERGLDGGSYPSPRTFMVGLKLSL